jgi:hypothetical protein
MISGFKLYVNGSFWRGPSPDVRAYTLYGLEPSCGERLELQMTAYSGATLAPDRESPRSNTRVLEGPPCPLPDLTPTDVTAHEPSGQLRIHVLNNGGDLVNQDITVNLVRISTNERIALPTWSGVNILSGGEGILQSSDLVLEPSDLRVIVDPANEIEETDEGNNIYETPVVMRVEFLRVHTSACNEGCNLISRDSEHVFYLWAGHGRTLSDANWVAGGVVFPPGGVLTAACDHRADSSPDEAWRMEGDERYTFEFEVPPDENLYVKVTGQEVDHGPSDWDSMGQVESGYTPAQNWGARDEPYDARYDGETSCDEPFCVECGFGHPGLRAWWRITRLD